MPTGSRAIGERARQPGAKLVVGYTLTERLSWTSSLDHTHARERRLRFDRPSLGTSLAWAATGRAGLYLDYFRFVPASRGAGYVNAGTTYLLSSEPQLDARAGVGGDGAGPGRFAGVGVSRRW